MSINQQHRHHWQTPTPPWTTYSDSEDFVVIDRMLNNSQVDKILCVASDRNLQVDFVGRGVDGLGPWTSFCVPIAEERTLLRTMI